MGRFFRLCPVIFAAVFLSAGDSLAERKNIERALTQGKPLFLYERKKEYFWYQCSSIFREMMEHSPQEISLGDSLQFQSYTVKVNALFSVDHVETPFNSSSRRSGLAKGSHTRDCYLAEDSGIFPWSDRCEGMYVLLEGCEEKIAEPPRVKAASPPPASSPQEKSVRKPDAPVSAPSSRPAL